MANVVDSLADQIISLEYDCRKTRFKDISDSDTFNAIENEKNVNTRKATDSHMKLFTKWLEANNELRLPEEIMPEELEMLIAKFLLSIRKVKEGKKNDHQYEPETLHAIHSSLNRYLGSKKYQADIKKDKEFLHSRNVLLAKKKEIKKLGKENKKNATQAFAAEEIDLFWEQDQLGTGQLIVI
jgi:hypothetical protein